MDQCVPDFQVDDDDECAAYWRREADRLQMVVAGLRREIEELRSPVTIVHRVVRDGVAVEKSIVRIPEEAWEREAARFPHLESWEWMTAAGLMFLFSPSLVSSDVPAVALADGPAAGDD